MKTTLNKINHREPYDDDWIVLLKHLGKTEADDDPLELLTILDSNGVRYALEALRYVDGYEREMRLFAVWCARQVQHLMTDQRSLNALDVAERYANGQASVDELNLAETAANQAYLDAATIVNVLFGRCRVAEMHTRSAAWAAEAATFEHCFDAAICAARGASEARPSRIVAQEKELRRILLEIKEKESV